MAIFDRLRKSTIVILIFIISSTDSLSAESPKTKYQEAFQLSLKGKSKEAIDIYLQALKLKPEWPEVHHNLGFLYFERNMGIKGLDHFRKAEYYYSIGSDAQSKINLSIIRKNLTKGYKKLDINPHDFEAFPTFSTKLEWHEAGAGFLIGSKGHVLTSRQTVVKANQIRVRFQDGRALDAKPIRIFIIYNIALLKVDDLSQYPKTVLNFGSSSFLKYGEDVLIPDPAPDGKINDFPRRGSIRAINALEDNDKFFQIDLPIQENQNGAPLFNSKGNIVGMVFSKSFMENSYIQTKNLSDDSSFAIKSIYLQQILGDILKITTPSDQPNPLTLTNNYQKFSKEAQMNLVVIETIP